MEDELIVFLEKDVCDGSAWSLRWGTLILYGAGFVFYYNKLRKSSMNRLQDTIKLSDIVEVSVEKMDWLVSKLFWVGRKLVILKTREGEKRYYLRDTENLLIALKMINPSINLVDKTQ